MKTPFGCSMMIRPRGFKGDFREERLRREKVVESVRVKEKEKVVAAAASSRRRKAAAI